MQPRPSRYRSICHPRRSPQSCLQSSDADSFQGRYPPILIPVRGPQRDVRATRSCCDQPRAPPRIPAYSGRLQPPRAWNILGLGPDAVNGGTKTPQLGAIPPFSSLRLTYSSHTYFDLDSHFRPMTIEEPGQHPHTAPTVVTSLHRPAAALRLPAV